MAVWKHLPSLVAGVLTWATLGSLFAGDPELDSAVLERDTEAIVSRMSSLVREDAGLAARFVPEAYAAMERTNENDFYQGDRYRVFRGAVQALSLVREKNAKILEKSFKKSSVWQVRFIILHAALQNPDLDAFDMAMEGVKAKQSAVAALAARILGNGKKKVALDPLVNAMETWEEDGVRESIRKGRRAVASKGVSGVAWMACRDALHKLTGLSFHAAADYRNYIKAHRKNIDPTNVDLSVKPEERTGVGLFGLDVTGRNIVFILDISGSMEATDPLTPEQEKQLRRRLTGVVGDNKLEEEMIKARRRILRAKSELQNVIASLSEDRRFNLIVYSSKVQSWEESLVQATSSAKKKAHEFIEGLKASGVTVTDDALHRAFSDPMLDTVYLITDGAPTHRGSRGPQLPPDAKRLMSLILEETKAANYLRQVRLFTLGFVGAEVEFLKRLSAENFGTYQDIK